MRHRGTFLLSLDYFTDASDDDNIEITEPNNLWSLTNQKCSPVLYSLRSTKHVVSNSHIPHNLFCIRRNQPHSPTTAQLGRITLIDSSLELKDVVDRSLMKMREDSALHNCFGVDELDHACLPFTQSSFHIRCSEGGEIEISNLNGGDGVETVSTWISSSDCQLTAKETISHSPFFVPTLNTSSSKVTFNKKSSTHAFTLIGSTFIPCGLFLEVFERSVHNGRNGEYTRELTESSTLSFTETAITLAIPQKEIAASIAVEAEGHARLVFGDGSRTESFRVKLSGSDERKALTKQAMKWVVPVNCACVALLLFIIILLRHRS
ncbi:hypothetical protein BLNAU_1693 [Blattamonas nauphoetae]|uniref:Uncharacterized protein n=1 Tax=Blattamonas nauphoetae TaxID=2049346 RepID=A0ABQ9YHC2_9EUKA|nr:hypothetical protein BLNAU_1693 [Blattamonas nauphoetae]